MCESCREKLAEVQEKLDIGIWEPLSEADGDNAALRHMFVKRLFCGHQDCAKNQEFHMTGHGRLENSTHLITRKNDALTVLDKETGQKQEYDLEPWEKGVLKLMNGKLGLADAMGMFDALGTEQLYEIAKIAAWETVTESQVLSRFGANSAVADGKLIRFKDYLIRRQP